jgi:hypothetical protein
MSMSSFIFIAAAVAGAIFLSPWLWILVGLFVLLEMNSRSVEEKERREWARKEQEHRRKVQSGYYSKSPSETDASGDA